MPINATDYKDIVRVTFSCSGEQEEHPERYESEIVCFLQITDAGLNIFYSHHVIRVRESSVGPFTREVARRVPLSTSLSALIDTGVMHEFWSTFKRHTRISPGPISGMPIALEED